MNFNNGGQNSFGFSNADFETFKSSYSHLTNNTYRNDYYEANLFSKVLAGIGKKNFEKLAISGLGMSESDLSYLTRKIAAFDVLADQNLWETIGYSGIRKILRLSEQQKSQLLSQLRGETGLTLYRFIELYSTLQQMQDESTTRKSESRKSESRKSESRKSETRKSSRSNSKQVVLDMRDLTKLIDTIADRKISGLRNERKNHGERKNRNERNRNRNRRGKQARSQSTGSIFPATQMVAPLSV